jgi:hypothetical protein
VVSQIAFSERREEQRLRLARRAAGERPQAVARHPQSLQEVIALGQPQLDQFAVVAVCRAREQLERGAGGRISFRRKQPLRASELEFVPRAASRDGLPRVDLVPGRTREVAQGKFIVHTRERRARLVAIARRARRAAQSHQDVVRR